MKNMNERTSRSDIGHPCETCDTRKWYARRFDIHIFSEDCFYECEEYNTYKKTIEEEKNGSEISEERTV